MTGYIGIGGTAKKVKNIYVGVGGVAKKVKKGYIGVGGVAKLWYSSQREWVWDKYTVNAGYNEVQGTSIAVERTSAFYAGTSYTLSQSTGEFTVAQTTQIARSRTGATNAVGKYYISLSSSSGTQTGSTVYLITAASYSFYTLDLTVTPITSQYYEAKGSLIGSVTDLDVTAYPPNGVQSGYWYVLRDVISISYSGSYSDTCLYVANKAYRLLTITGSGTLALGNSSAADIWLCGGGGSGMHAGTPSGGGGGGYAQEIMNTTIQNLVVTIGAGGSPTSDSPGFNTGGSSSISGDASGSAAGGNTQSGTAKGRYGGSGGGGGGRGIYGGNGDGLDKLPFDDNYFPYPFCDGGGGGGYLESSYRYDGGAGGTNGGNGGNASHSDSPKGGAGGGHYGGAGGYSGYPSAIAGGDATGYGSGGGGGYYGDHASAGGYGYQGVCFIRIPLE